MNSTDNPLEQLRDIHLPVSVSIWPPAPGWWLLVLLVIILLISGFWVYRRFICPNVRKQALEELTQLNQRLADELNFGKGSIQFYIDISILVRRIAISIFGSKQVAGLAGEPWLKFLDETSKTTFFTAGNGRLLISAPYSNNTNTLAGIGDHDSDNCDFSGTHNSPEFLENSENERVDLEQFSIAIKNWVLKNT